MASKIIRKAVVITGGSRGIGKAVAETFLKNNCKVFLVSKHDDTLKLAKNYLSERVPGSVSDIHLVPCDITDVDEAKKSFSKISRESKVIDVLINSAGINEDKLLMRTDVDSIRRIFDTNLIGTINMCKLALKSMIQQKSGSIVNIGSVIGKKGNAGQTIYSASKSGLVGFTRSLAKEVGSRNITVNMVSPGFIQTDMTKMIDTQAVINQTCLGKVGLPNDVAEAVYFLSNASYITGANVPVDGGML